MGALVQLRMSEGVVAVEGERMKKRAAVIRPHRHAVRPPRLRAETNASVEGAAKPHLADLHAGLPAIGRVPIDGEEVSGWGGSRQSQQHGSDEHAGYQNQNRKEGMVGRRHADHNGQASTPRTLRALTS